MDKGIVDCLVGLQWGSEGKGKISDYLSLEYNGIVRNGGPQAGHSFYRKNNKYINRQIPCGVFNSNCKFYIGANSIINLEVLLEEIKRYQLTPKRLMIDNNAAIITAKEIDSEKESFLKERLASTLEGVGATQAQKIWRNAQLFGNNSAIFHRECLVYKIPELYFFAGDVSESIHQQIQANAPVLLEGTQGFGLSLNHGNYPFVTSRDVNSSSLLSDSGISPVFHGQTIGVMRTYPIRVGGNSGPVGSNELTWEEITKRSSAKKPIIEYTSVTKRKRRVFEQDFAELYKAIEINQPKQIALMFLDYINAEDYGKNNFRELSKESKEEIKFLEKCFDIPITLIGTGPKREHIIDLRQTSQKRKPLKNINNKIDGFVDNFMGQDIESGYLKRYIQKKHRAIIS